MRDAINFCEQYLRTEPNAAASAEVRTRLDNLHPRLAAPTVTRPSLPPAATVVQSPVSPSTGQPVTEIAKPTERQPALALLIGGAAMLGIGAGTGAAALATSRELEAGPVFADVDGLKRRGRR